MSKQIKVTVRLVGKDDVVHGEGLVDSSKVAAAHVLERNYHVYAFQRMQDGVVIFQECGVPIFINEF